MLCKTCNSLQINKTIGDKLRRELAPSFLALSRSANSGCELCQLVYQSLQGRVSVAAAAVRYSFEDRTEDGFRTMLVEAFDQGKSVTKESFDLSCNLDSLAAKSNLIAGRPISAEPLSEACISQIQHWIGRCTSAAHPRCPLPEDPRMPTRIIDVGSTTTKPFLKISQPQDTGRWVALSHCWGALNKLFTTRIDNIVDMQKGIELSDLPATVRDAVLVVRRLGLRYLWADNLCIIQDTDEDFAKENTRMGEYYRNSYLTIVASDARSDDEGFLRPRKSSSTSSSTVSVPLKRSKSGTSDNFFISRRQSSLSEVEPEDAFIHRRAWCLQESALAIRVLEFTDQQVKWSCASRSIRESGELMKAAYADILTLARQALNATTITSEEQTKVVKKTFGKIGRKFVQSVSKSAVGQSLIYELPSRSFRLGNLNTWYDTVENFMSRDISYTSDRLPAIGAIARAIHEQTGDTYLAGLWKSDIRRGLVWSVAGDERRTQHTVLRDSESLRPPSWSWASVEATIKYPVETRSHLYRDNSCWRWTEYRFPEREKNQAVLVGYTSRNADKDAFGRQNGGAIRLQTLCRPGSDLLGPPFRGSTIKRKAIQYRQYTDQNNYQVYYDRAPRTDVEKPDASLARCKVCMVVRGPYMYTPGGSIHVNAHLWSQLSADENIRGGAYQSGLFLTVALILEETKTAGDWKRIGLIEIYDAEGWSPGVGWEEESVVIV